MPLEQLKQFRTGVYTILGKAKDALFDFRTYATGTKASMRLRSKIDNRKIENPFLI